MINSCPGDRRVVQSRVDRETVPRVRLVVSLSQLDDEEERAIKAGNGPQNPPDHGVNDQHV